MRGTSGSPRGEAAAGRDPGRHQRRQRSGRQAAQDGGEARSLPGRAVLAVSAGKPRRLGLPAVPGQPQVEGGCHPAEREEQAGAGGVCRRRRGWKGRGEDCPQEEGGSEETIRARHEGAVRGLRQSMRFLEMLISDCRFIASTIETRSNTCRCTPPKFMAQESGSVNDHQDHRDFQVTT